jgi:branched-chain amino acid transport system substrate-binding protein
MGSLSWLKRSISLMRKSVIAAGIAAMVVIPVSQALAQDKVKVGLMLALSGTFGKTGEMTADGFRLAMEQNGDRLGDREVELILLDSEADPGRAVSNMQKLVSGDKVDFVVGPMHSGVAMGMLKVARQEGTILIIPNAGLNAATRELCAPNIFRTSFSNWQPGFAMGQVAHDRGYRNVVTITWRYGAGQETVAAFKDSFLKAGGSIAREIYLPFPEVEFQAQLTEIASLKPDAVYAFFAGGGAAKFVKDYSAAGLKGKIPLIGAGFLTEGTLQAQGQTAEGILTTLHYADVLDNPANKSFRAAFRKRYGAEADLYAMQGYDTGMLLIKAVEAAGGNPTDREGVLRAMRQVKLDSPRGPVTFSDSHNPVQNIYLREVREGENVVIGTAHEALADPGTGCSL